MSSQSRLSPQKYDNFSTSLALLPPPPPIFLKIYPPFSIRAAAVVTRGEILVTCRLTITSWRPLICTCATLTVSRLTRLPYAYIYWQTLIIYILIISYVCVFFCPCAGLPVEPKPATRHRTTRAVERLLEAILAGHPRRGRVRQAYTRFRITRPGRPGDPAQSRRF